MMKHEKRKSRGSRYRGKWEVIASGEGIQMFSVRLVMHCFPKLGGEYVHIHCAQFIIIFI